MKTFKHISLIAVVLLLAFTAQTAYAGNFSGKKKDNQQNLITIKGKVIDAETELLWCLQLLPLRKPMLQ